MPSISINATGSRTARLAYTTTATKTPTMSWKYAVLFIKARKEISVLATGGSFSGSQNPSVLTWDKDVDIGWLADCSTCQWVAAAYKIYYVYDPPNTGGALGDETWSLVETGTVAVSGALPCSDCDGGVDAGGDTGGDVAGGGVEGAADNPYGASSTGESPSEPSPPASDPCLPPQPSAPSPTVPTPCSSGSGSPGPTGFS